MRLYNHVHMEQCLVIGKFSLEKQGESQWQECWGQSFPQCFLDHRISLEALHGWLELVGSIAKLESSKH